MSGRAASDDGRGETITTERLGLRPWREADKPWFARVLYTPAVMAHMGGPMSRPEVDALLDRQMAMQAAHGLSFWAVERREDGTLVGTCGLRYGGEPQTPVDDELEIGWRIAQAQWGRDYAREAAQASIAWGWRHTGRSRIAAWTVAANRSSWGLMLRLGMRPRPDLAFDHPRFPEGHRLRRHRVYTVERPRPFDRAAVRR